MILKKERDNGLLFFFFFFFHRDAKFLSKKKGLPSLLVVKRPTAFEKQSGTRRRSSKKGRRKKRKGEESTFWGIGNNKFSASEGELGCAVTPLSRDSWENVRYFKKFFFFFLRQILFRISRGKCTNKSEIIPNNKPKKNEKNLGGVFSGKLREIERKLLDKIFHHLFELPHSSFTASGCCCCCCFLLLLFSVLAECC